MLHQNLLLFFVEDHQGGVRVQNMVFDAGFGNMHISQDLHHLLLRQQVSGPLFAALATASQHDKGK